MKATMRALKAIADLNQEFSDKWGAYAQRARMLSDAYGQRAEDFTQSVEPELEVLEYPDSGGQGLECNFELVLAFAKVYDALLAYHKENPNSADPLKLISPIMRIFEGSSLEEMLKEIVNPNPNPKTDD